MHRRTWLAASLDGITWTEILEAQQHAHAAARTGQKLPYLSKQAALDLEALTSEIVPTTATPGAMEAGVVYFIDRALTTFEKDKQQAYRDGLAAMNAKRGEMFSGSFSLAALTSV